MIQSGSPPTHTPRGPQLFSLLLLCTFAALTACASASVKAPSLRSDSPLQPGPAVTWVEDFSIPDAMEADADQHELAREVAQAVSRATIEGLNEAGYRAEPMPEPEDRPPLEPAFRAVVVSGRFDEIDDGNVFGRVLIGFGVGASRLLSQVAVSLHGAGTTEPLFDCAVDAHGSRMPGLIVPLGLASEIGLLVNGAMKAAGEIKGPLAGDARHTGEKLAERLVEVFRQLEWTGRGPVWGN